ncbi:MAG TPA: hypothetical protein PLU11_09895 [Chitinophagaceae bacterium]|nr:hypothetical protein [Chitinophagaceae bacterium]HPH33129.1 hypothetical protein [Chitinophagaceae bacterium]HPN59477.1 hypothetical protein [Chitinophagaceae bacterium]
MRNLLLITALIWVVELNSQGNVLPSGELGTSFLSSLQLGKFGPLEKYIPTVAFYKSLGKEMAGRSDKEIGQLRDQSTTRLKENWKQILERVRKDGIDLAGVLIRETLVYDIMPGKPMQGMVVVYGYKGHEYDDLSLIVNQQPGKTWLLEIPNSTRVFKMDDSTLRNSKQARQVIALSDPQLKKQLESQVKAMIRQAKGDSLQAFGSQVIFRGEPASKNWKSALNMNLPEEVEQAERLMKQVSKAMAGCSDYKMESMRVEKESEGNWLVQPVKCGSKKVYFAFLMTGSGLLLGDLDTESE